MDTRLCIDTLNRRFMESFSQKKVVLSLYEYLKLVESAPRQFLRTSAQYLVDTMEHFGTTKLSSGRNSVNRFKLFDLGTARTGPIIGGESVQNELYNLFQSFKRMGFSSHLALLHGPNGSAKSSTIETLANAMEAYSQTEAGAIYRFNWIFPADERIYPQEKSGNQRIGFQNHQDPSNEDLESFAGIEERRIAAKLGSEFKENPIFLLPMPFREEFLRDILAGDGQESDPKIPPHLLLNGLSKTNRDIFENLLNAYKGDLKKVLRHVQVERFFFSRQYRVGISTVEPQHSIDAFEKQVTMDANYANLPAILRTINFHQYGGPLIEANRGLIEFSDLLKRPMETFKYLLGTIEKGTIGLDSGSALLDVVFVGSTNDKHLDAFKTVPDFSSFKGRFELITVPYLLLPELESKIFMQDVSKLSAKKSMAPHTVELMSLWGVLTRLKQPDQNSYPDKYRSVIAKLDPLSKLRLYQDKTLMPTFTREEESLIREIRAKILEEGRRPPIYEGRFGASPRELRSILHRAAHGKTHQVMTPMCVFSEIAKLITDKSVYEFLQFETRDKYHDVEYFLQVCKDTFADTFEGELIASMAIAEAEEYSALFARYLTHLVAHLKGEKIWDDSSKSYVAPSTRILESVEAILNISESVEAHRNGVLSRIAAWKIECPNEDIDVEKLFPELLDYIRSHFYKEKQELIEANIKAMMALSAEERLTDKQKNSAEESYTQLEDKFGYSRTMATECLRWYLNYRRDRHSRLLPSSGA